MRIKVKELHVGIIFFVLFFQIGALGIYQDVNGQKESTVPEWIKTLAGFWSNNEITDKEFTNSIEYLIEKKIIISERIVILENTDNDKESNSQEIVILDWIRNNAKWYSEEIISESEFLSGIEFMVEERIIQSPRIQILDEEVNQENGLPDKSLTVSNVEISPPESSGWGDQHIKLSWTYQVEHVDNTEAGFPTRGHFLIEITGIETVTGEAEYIGDNKFAGNYNGIDPGIGGGVITITVISFIGDDRGNYVGDGDQKEVIILPYTPEE